MSKQVLVLSRESDFKKRERHLIQDYKRDMRESDIFILLKDSSSLLKDLESLNIKIPLKSLLMTFKSNYKSYNVLAKVKTDNSNVMSIFAKKLMPKLLKSLVNVEMDFNSIETKTINNQNIEISFLLDKSEVIKIMSFIMEKLQLE